MNRQFVFFSGKGGVGKSSMASANAVYHAEAGLRTLIVTTDPAPNLSDVFEQPIGHSITAIQGVHNLWAMEIDPDSATQEYKDRALAPIRAAFPAEMVQVIEEQMNGPCTTEVAAFDRFTDFLDGLSVDGQAFNMVIFDTAPTGHTLRLLELPAAWSHFIEEAAQGSGQTCIGPAAAVQEAKLKYARAIATMRDPAQTTFVFVLQPEDTAIKETKRAIAELGKLDIQTYQLIVNGIFPRTEAANPFFAQRVKMQEGYLQQIGREFPLPTQRVSLLNREIRGIARLREVAKRLYSASFIAEAEISGDGKLEASGTTRVVPSCRSEVHERILPNGRTRLIFFVGKGGVGKTAASCITAIWLARLGYRTLLLTTDPAAHLGDVLGLHVSDEVAQITEVPSLWVANIDPKSAAQAYKDRILDDARRRGRPPKAIEAMAEELDSPCTEEMAAFDRFVDFASQDEWAAIVFDTAPTGHTLRLLELPFDWGNQLDAKVFVSVDSAADDEVAKKRFGRVIETMRDPARCTFAFVMYPECTPVIEAYRASEELRTLGIQPSLVVANLVLPHEQCTSSFTRARRAMQEKYLALIAERFSVPVLEIPLVPGEVRGIDVLTTLGKQVLGGEEVVGKRACPRR
ncbi:MAG: TRC40/GET3/ArsA family transport-energizing ATPase [Chloroflexi bacterium]|nr:TRC40/GET3/ArsA family transport-energizing ATPase [Chloroflexota bacterium]